MSHESLPQFLAKIDLFEGLSKDTLSDLIERGTTLKVPAGSRVIEQGAHDAGLQVVLEGSAAVEVNGGEGLIGGGTRMPHAPLS